MTSGARVAVAVAAGALLASWLFAAAGPFRQPDPMPAPRPAAKPPEIDRLASVVQAQTDRLRARVARQPAPGEPTRNPFSFKSQDPGPRSRGVVAAAVEPDRVVPVEPAPPSPAIRLVGITTDAGVHRAAMSVSGEIVVVAVGDLVAGRYRVTAVSIDVVELVDALGGPTLRLGLR